MTTVSISTGSQPGVGSFAYSIEPDGQDWRIFMVMNDGERRERYCSTWKGQPCNGLTKVYGILRENGFSIG